MVLLAAAIVPSAKAEQAPQSDSSRIVVLVPDGVWDGVADQVQRGWVVTSDVLGAIDG